MTLAYDDEQRAFISSISDALSHISPISLARAVAEGEDRWQEVWTHVVEMDVPALLVPEDAGGLGLTAVELVAVVEAAARFASPIPLAMTAGAFVPLVIAAGAHDASAEAILAEVMAGASGTVALAQPDGTSLVDASLADHRLTARCDGIPEAARARWIAVPAARPDGAVVLVVGSPAALAVNVDAAMDPTSPVGTLDVAAHDLDDATILAGDPRPAFAVAWTAAAAELVGLAAELVDRSVAHATDRVQFSKPIGSFQGVKHQLVDAHISVERARSLTLHAAMLASAGDPHAARGAHLAKAAASEAATTAARTAVQVHGGSGITKEADVSLLYLRARQQSQLLGGPDAHYAAVAAS